MNDGHDRHDGRSGHGWIRRLVTALGVLAAVNLMAGGAFLGWLLATDRMDAERFGELRRRVFTPIQAERAALEADEAARREESAAAIERVRLAAPPRTAAERAAEVDRALDQAQIRRRLVDEEARLLGRGLDERFARLREEESSFDRSETERRAVQAAEEALRSNAQFKKTVQLLEASSPRQSKEWLLELVRTGRRDDAVRYLDSMSTYTASRVLRELKSAEETTLAADLLEALQRGSKGAANGAP